MHAVDIRHFTVSQIGIAALAIGVLAAGIIGFMALSDVTSDSGSLAAPAGIRQVSQTDTMRFLELNTQLPNAAAAPALTSTEIRFLEMNTILPDAAPALTRGIEEILFFEMNTLLPGEATPKVLSYAEIRFLEMNTQLLGSDTLVAPSPLESLPVGGDTRY